MTHVERAQDHHRLQGKELQHGGGFWTPFMHALRTTASWRCWWSRTIALRGHSVLTSRPPCPLHMNLYSLPTDGRCSIICTAHGPIPLRSEEQIGVNVIHQIQLCLQLHNTIQTSNSTSTTLILSTGVPQVYIQPCALLPVHTWLYVQS